MANNTKKRDNKTPSSFQERLGSEDIQINDFKVDELRKIASELDISGSHEMNKEQLVDTINKARRNP